MSRLTSLVVSMPTLPAAPVRVAAALIVLAGVAVLVWAALPSAQNVLRVGGGDPRHRAGCRPVPAPRSGGTRAGCRPARVPQATQNPGGDPDTGPGAAGYHLADGPTSPRRVPAGSKEANR